MRNAIGLTIGNIFGLVGSVLVVLSYSTFTDTFNTLMTAYSPEIGPDWEMLKPGADLYAIGAASGPVQNVLNKRIAGVYASQYEPAVVNVLESNVRVTCGMYARPSYSSVGVAWRGGSETNPTFWIVLPLSSSSMGLFHYDGTTYNQKGSYAFTLTDAVHPVKVEVLGSSIKVWFDGVLAFDIVDTLGQANTKHGVAAFQFNNINYWDDFKVEEL